MYYYLLLVVPALLVAMIAQLRVKSTFRRYSRYSTAARITGAQASFMIQKANGISVPVQPIGGELTDHYDPTKNTIGLSDPVYAADSVSAVGVAAHETGHALQYAEQYAPIRFRMALVPVTNFSATISPYLILAGLIAGWDVLAYAGIALFSFSVLFQLVTLPVEFNASSRAIRILEGNGMLGESEITGAKKVLRAAAMTYVASLASSLFLVGTTVISYSASAKMSRISASFDLICAFPALGL